MKKLTGILAFCVTCILLTAVNLGCTSQADNNKNTTNTSKGKDMKTLVAYFSRLDENYGVGYITKGNTEIIAEMIAKKTSADLFHIETVTPYPKEYGPCTDVAKKEVQSNARPEIKGDIEVEKYDVIYIGYPNWWSEPPMAVFTFIEKHNWQGKIVIPFCTHEGSGLGVTEQSIKKACKGATLRDGLAVQGTVAQNSRDKAEAAVNNWLKNIEK